jgi:hypothetical protein
VGSSKRPRHARGARQRAEQRAGENAEREAGGDARERRPRVQPKVSVRGEFGQGRRDLARRRREAALREAGPHGDLPQDRRAYGEQESPATTGAGFPWRPA